MRKLITIVYFQIGVNVIGLPEIIRHDVKTVFFKTNCCGKNMVRNK